MKMEEYYYLTDKDTRMVRVHIRDKQREEEVGRRQAQEASLKRSVMQLDRSARVFYQTFVFFPQQWEAWSQNTITAYRKKYNFRFFLWGLTHPKEVKEHCSNDLQYLRTLQSSLITSFSMTFFAAVFVNRFARRLDPPFFYDFYFNRKYQPKHLRLLTVLSIVGYMTFRELRFIANDVFLFDTGLKYKELIAPGEMTDTRIDSLRLGPQVVKNSPSISGT